MLFKNPPIQRQYSKLKPKLREIVRFIERRAMEKFGDEIVVTEIWRNKKGTVHYYYRGIDLAILVFGELEGTEEIREEVNSKFPYGKPGIDTIPPLDHGTAPHIHIQVISG